MPLDTNEIIGAYGPWAALFIIYFLPIIRDKLFPWLAQEQKLRREQEAQREERLLKLLEQNTSAFTDLRAAVNNLDTTLRDVRNDLRDVREDVVRIYTQLGIEKHQD